MLYARAASARTCQHRYPGPQQHTDLRPAVLTCWTVCRAVSRTTTNRCCNHAIHHAVQYRTWHQDTMLHHTYYAYTRAEQYLLQQRASSFHTPCVIICAASTPCRIMLYTTTAVHTTRKEARCFSHSRMTNTAALAE